MGVFRIRRDSVGPPQASLLSWWKADALNSLPLADGASVATWPDQRGAADLTKIGGATVTYSLTNGPTGLPCVMFNESGGLNGARGADPGAVYASFHVIYNNFPTGPQVFKNEGFYASEPSIGDWDIGGTTGHLGGGDTFAGSQWIILLTIWNGASSAIYQAGGAAAGTGTVTGTNGTGVNLGGAAGSGSWNGRIAERLDYTTASLAALNPAGAYLHTKYGLAWTAAV